MGIIKIECPTCNQHYSVDVSIIGHNVECSVCGNTFQVGTKNVISWNAEQQESRFSQAQQPPPQYSQQQYSQQQYSQQQHSQQQYSQQPQYAQPMQEISVSSFAESDKDRNTFALLGFFLGFLGVHSFYLGKTRNGIATILANFLCSPPVVIFFVGIELLITTTDCQMLPLKNKESPVALVLGILMPIGGIFLFFITIQFYMLQL